MQQTQLQMQLLKQVQPVCTRKSSPLYRQNPTVQDRKQSAKDIVLANLTDCLVALFLLTGVLTVLLYVVRLVAGV